MLLAFLVLALPVPIRAQTFTDLRHSWIGLAAGLASSPALLGTLSNIYLALALAGVIGVGFALVFGHSQHAYIDSLMTGASFGIPLWASLSIIIFPGRGGNTTDTPCAKKARCHSGWRLRWYEHCGKFRPLLWSRPVARVHFGKRDQCSALHTDVGRRSAQQS
jgi:hypothetical protein